MKGTLHPESGNDQPCELLAALQQLCAETQATHLALVDGRLGAFQEHTSRLEELCGNLRRHQAVTTGLATGSELTPSALDNRILALHYRVSELNYRLSALLRRSLRTVSLLTRHYQTVFGSSSAGGECSPDLHTWSSEV